MTIDDMKYCAACERLERMKETNPILRSLIIRVALDVGWAEVMSDSLYNDGLSAPPLPLRKAFARRALTELTP
jgi:hypothetical protein